MSTLDINSYINSKDVAEHCRNINKEWTPFEMAIIIGRSYRAIPEKHAAWRELIAEYPDMPLPDKTEYLHKKLTDLIDYEERKIALFNKTDTGVFYTYKVWRREEYRYDNCVFSTIEKVFEDIREDWDADETKEIVINKVYIDGGRIEADVDYNGNIYDIHTYGLSGEYDEWFTGLDTDELYRFVDCYFLEIPLPFKRGDILAYTNKSGVHDDRIFVFDRSPYDDAEHYERMKPYRDGSDMMIWGLYVSDNGVLYGGHSCSFDCLEYYRGKLEGNDRLLHYVELFIKGKIHLPELLVMQNRIMLERIMNEELGYQNHGCYIRDEDLVENRCGFTDNKNESREGE